MALITPQQISEAGTADLTLTAAAGGGDTMTWKKGLLLFIVNGSGGSITVTIAEQVSGTISDVTYGDIEKADATLAVGAGNTGCIGPFTAKSFSSSGVITITYSGVTSLTVAGVYI